MIPEREGEVWGRQGGAEAPPTHTANPGWRQLSPNGWGKSLLGLAEEEVEVSGGPVTAEALVVACL